MSVTFAPRAHRRERRVTRRIEKRDPTLRGLDVIGADVLRNAAGFTCGHLRPADVVEQRRLAMVDVPHDRHDRGTADRLRGARGLLDRLDQLILDSRLFERLRGMAHLLDDERRGVLVEHLIDRDHHAHLHERLDDLVGLDGHALRELADSDRLADLDFTNHGRRRLLEAVLRIDADRYAATTLLFLLAPAAHTISDVQRVIAIGRLFHHALFLGFLPRAFGFGSLLRLFFPGGGLTTLLFGSLFRCLVGCRQAALLVLEALALVGLALLGC